MLKMDYLSAYCCLITKGEEPSQSETRAEILETEIGVEENWEGGNKLKVIYSSEAVKHQNRKWKVGTESE